MFIWQKNGRSELINAQKNKIEIDNMKRIMFNDKYCLTDAVIEGRKTMTRRACTISITERDTMKDVAIDNQLAQIKEIAPKIAIIEV